MYRTLPLFKSHYSAGKSILTLEEPTDKKGNPVPNSIFHLLKSNNLDTLVLVDDNVSGVLQASETAKKSKIKLKFGLRLWVTEDALDKKEENLTKRAKYIIFVKNYEGYKILSKIWSWAAKDGFYYEPCIDFKTLKSLWNNDNLKLAIPFYDSFIFLNTLEGHTHVPHIEFTKPFYLVEDNGLPFDKYINGKIRNITGASIIPAQSIFYEKKDDFIAYLAGRCLHNRSTLDKPELSHMGTDEFNFQKWLKNEKV